MATITPIDYSNANVTAPIIRGLTELPPREEIRQHRKMVEKKAPRRRYQNDTDDEDDDEPRIVPVPVAHMHVGADNAVNYPVLPEQDTTPGILWRVVSRIQWRNKSDGAAPCNAAAGLVRGLSFDERALFTREYNNAIGAAVIVLTDIFAANNIIDAGDKLKVTSHVIALGRDQYQTFMEDITLFAFLIECDEAQSFDAAIRPAM